MFVSIDIKQYVWLQQKESNHDATDRCFELRPTLFVYPLVDEDEDEADHHTHENDPEYDP